MQEALRSARDYWTPERIAASVPLDDLFTVYGDTSGLVETYPTHGIGDERGLFEAIIPADEMEKPVRISMSS